MGFQASTRLRLSAAAFLFAVAAGCGGSGGDVIALPPPAEPPEVPPQLPLNFGTHPSAGVVLGQSLFDTDDPGNTLGTFFFPRESAVTADGRLIVLDSRNDALKTFSDYDATPAGRTADFQSTILAVGISASGSRVTVTRAAQVLIFDSWPTAPGALQPVAFAGTGQIDCNSQTLTGATSAFITPQGRLLVADTENHRVLIWNSIPASGGSLGPANEVLGQESMNTCEENGGRLDGPSAGVLSSPTSVWSDDQKVLVVDSGNNRVLVWNTFPATGDGATHVIGQSNVSDSEANAGGSPRGHTLSGPRALDVNDRGQLVVTDAANHRVLVWNKIPGMNGQAADQVIGQADLNSAVAASPSERSLFRPHGVRFHGRNLIVSEPERNRVLVWRALD